MIRGTYDAGEKEYLSKGRSDRLLKQNSLTFNLVKFLSFWDSTFFLLNSIIQIWIRFKSTGRGLTEEILEI